MNTQCRNLNEVNSEGNRRNIFLKLLLFRWRHKFVDETNIKKLPERAFYRLTQISLLLLYIIKLL